MQRRRIQDVISPDHHSFAGGSRDYTPQDYELARQQAALANYQNYLELQESMRGAGLLDANFPESDPLRYLNQLRGDYREANERRRIMNQTPANMLPQIPFNPESAGFTPSNFMREQKRPERRRTVDNLYPPVSAASQTYPTGGMLDNTKRGMRPTVEEEQGYEQLMRMNNPDRNERMFQRMENASLLSDNQQTAPSESGLLQQDGLYNNPQMMGLLQAGLGLLSQPSSSLDPAKVSLQSALAGGLAGYLQGFGGTKKRLYDQEQDRIEREFKRQQLRQDKDYKKALTDQALALIKKYESDIANDQVPKLDRGALIQRMTDLSAKYTKESLNVLRDDELVKEFQAFMADQRAMERDQAKPVKEPKLTETQQYLQTLNNPDATQDPDSRFAFFAIYAKPLSSDTVFNPETNQNEVIRSYLPVDPVHAERFPDAFAELQKMKETNKLKPLSATEVKDKQRGRLLQKLTSDIISNNYDTALEFDEVGNVAATATGMSFFSSDKYKRRLAAQDRWIENVLRAASRAAILAEEYGKYREMYFPTFGETDETNITEKREAREAKLQEALLKFPFMDEKDKQFLDPVESDDDDLNEALR